ncbi:etoposide-induced protein 2.4 (EI24) [Nitrosospira sp. Nsp2]|uniref:EI24 domain-containing protein n=1 Tax=Nitrosospira sp. Nsp2 TaxID=136548 RepID=UPI000D30EE66|nr:EI24 domain-containing protein [Nitrosospira sp. Nsp2]PTR17277.1 etoposide-induced protein 2.4 (EI24) [Nitrosospira sp. Nsp2]
MTPVFEALSRAFRDMFQFQVLWIIIWPILAAGLLWLILGVAFWNTFSVWIASGLTAIGIQTWLEGVEPRWIAYGIQGIAHLILFVPLVFVTALVITALFAMPALIRLVAIRDYPSLARKNGGGFAGSVLNALLALAIFIAIWVVTFPLWLIGVGVIIPFVATAYLNQRLFRYDALAEHASREEMQAIFSTQRPSLWVLGLLTGLMQFIPFINLVAPVLAALAFIHFGLFRLSELRGLEAGP